MFVEMPRTWIATVLLGGFALPHIWMRTLAVSTLSVAVTVAYLTVPPLHYSLTSTPCMLIGLPLGIFLGFRNNTADGRQKNRRVEFHIRDKAATGQPDGTGGTETPAPTPPQ